jgi:hypothetical protein
LFSNGYVLALPWQQPPKSKQVRVIVRFQLSDGRVFEADRDILINTGPMVLPTPPGVTEPKWPGPELPPPKELIPAPKQPPVMPPANPVGPVLNSTSHWQAPRLSHAVKMHRPEPLYGNSDRPPAPPE